MSQNPDIRDNINDIERYTHLVSQVFTIDHFSLGGSQDDYLIVYAGSLKQDSEKAYEFISLSLQQYQLTPLFRIEDNKHKIILRKGVYRPKTPNISLNIVLFFITFLSIIIAGLLTTPGFESNNPADILTHIQTNLVPTLGFAISLFSILIAHEFGHYFAARYHKTKVTLPYFIPFPLSPFGTMGAYIRLLEPPKNKKVLLDIGLAGPLAGLIIAIPVLVYGLSLSTVEVLPSELPPGFTFEGNSILYLLLKYLVHGSWLPEPSSFGGIHPLLYWTRYFFTGDPLPVGGKDVLIHPIAWAGWAGLLVTSLNLLPAGQLDGGHLVYSLFGDKLKWIRPAILVILVVLGFMWSGWWLWAFLILFLGGIRAAPLDEITDLDPGRKTLARIGLVVILLVFMPVPLILV
jgi:membrane-associated protease RseP (regulator of RpoE activity)